MMGFGKSKSRASSATVKPYDPEGHRIIGTTEDTNEPIRALKGHSLLLSANGGGKTTNGGVPWLYSLASSSASEALLVLDSKNGEIAIQCAQMLADLGRKVAVIDDMGVWTSELAPHRRELNGFSLTISTYCRAPEDLIFSLDAVNFALVEEPSGDEKHKYWRAWPRKILECAERINLKRSHDRATPGAASTIINDPDLLKTYAEIEAREGDPALQTLAKSLLAMMSHEHWPQHLEEAQRSLRLFSAGTRLHDAGRKASKSHADLIREGYIIFLVGPQSKMTRLGAYYALHIMSFCNALFECAGVLRVIADEFTNCPLKSLVEKLTTIRGFGGEIHMIAQSRSEIIRKFGEQETKTIEENSVVKQWFGFSSFEEAERVSKAMGDEHAVQSSLGTDNASSKAQTNLSLIKQRVMTPAELMAMPRGKQLIHMKGIGFLTANTLGQQHIEPYCHLIAENPMEGGKLPSDPKITLVTPEGRS